MFSLAPLTRDACTGLPDHTALIARFTHELERMQHKHAQITLMLVTLDGLPGTDAVRGQAHYDQLLSVIAIRLQRAIRKSDVVARWNADTFAVLLRDVRGGAHVTAVAWRVTLVCNTAITTGDSEIRLQARVGYARYPENGQSPEEVIAHAEVALGASSFARSIAS